MKLALISTLSSRRRTQEASLPVLLFPAHQRRQAQVRKVLARQPDRDDRVRPHHVPSGQHPRLPGNVVWTTQPCGNRIPPICWSRQDDHQEGCSLRPPVQGSQEVSRCQVHVLQPCRHQLVQAGRAEDQVWTTGPHQGASRHPRTLQGPLRPAHLSTGQF